MENVGIADMVSERDSSYNVGGFGQKIDPRDRVLAMRFLDYLGTVSGSIGVGMYGGSLISKFNTSAVELANNSEVTDYLIATGVGGAILMGGGIAIRSTNALFRAAKIVKGGEYKGLVNLLRRI
tara:strand:+ start:1403 stop:1774 length:372 start_codon:yes stop_codon:yes gene_type:complete